MLIKKLVDLPRPYTLSTSVIVASLIAGYVAALGNYKLTALIIAVLFGFLISLFPSSLFWLTLVISFVVSGLAQLYFPSLELIRWVVIPISFVYFLYILIGYTKPDYKASNIINRNLLLNWLLLSFIALNIFSAVINLQNLNQFLIGMKGYFQLWGLLFAFSLIDWEEDLLKRKLPKVIFILALVQLPFALHQYYFIAPLRSDLGNGIVPLDIVVGTFGGSINGGGANSVLAVFLFVVWSCYLATWKKGGVSSGSTILFTLILLLPVMINEAKVSIIYAVIIFFIVFRQGILKNKWRFIGVSLSFFLVIVALFITYVRHAPEGRVGSATDLIAYTIEYNLTQEEVFDGRLSRGGSIKLWLDSHGSIPNVLFGYGVGESRSDRHNKIASIIGVKDPIGYGVGGLAAIAILWESGILGFLMIHALFIVAFFYSRNLEKVFDHDKRMSGIFLGLQGAIAILYISIWHKNFFVFHIGYQIIIVVLFGYLAYWQSRQAIVLAEKKAA